MSLKPTEPIRDEHENVNGSLEKRIGDDANNEGEDSDDYEELDDEEVAGEEEEEEEEGKEEGEEAGKGQENTLTHLLLGNTTNGATKETAGPEYEEEEGEEGDYDDDDGDDDDDDEYVDDEDEDEPRTNKRSIDEVTDKEASQGSKRIKAWKSKQGALYKIQLKQPPSWQVECPSSTM